MNHSLVLAFFVLFLILSVIFFFLCLTMAVVFFIDTFHLVKKVSFYFECAKLCFVVNGEFAWILIRWFFCMY